MDTIKSVLESHGPLRIYSSSRYSKARHRLETTTLKHQRKCDVRASIRVSFLTRSQTWSFQSPIYLGTIDRSRGHRTVSSNTLTLCQKSTSIANRAKGLARARKYRLSAEGSARDVPGQGTAEECVAVSEDADLADAATRGASLMESFGKNQTHARSRSTGFFPFFQEARRIRNFKI